MGLEPGALIRNLYEKLALQLLGIDKLKQVKITDSTE